ncbi:MAG: hypothetical protein EPN59_12365 [Paraburkholderia sp.]|nr:MAG: hypothetical protein EPN59_12365 [Paraburkholderia sp.]
MKNSICDQQYCLLIRGWSIRGVAMYAIGTGLLLPGIAACDPANDPATGPGGGHGGGHGNNH